MREPIRVVVVDDQTVVREGLMTMLRLMDGVEPVGAAGDGDEALEVVAHTSPDVVLMDLRMPRHDGVDATARIREEHPGVRVIVLTTYSDDESIFAALQAGARGYLTKDASAEDLRRAIETVHAGNALMDPAVQARLLETIGRAPPAQRSHPDALTPREAEVLRLIARGRSNQEIATQLFITEATVKTHVNNIFSKIGARDRAQAVTYAFEHGLARPA